MIGSLLLGVYDEHGLRYVGNVGTGFSEAMLRDLAQMLRPLARPDNPFDTTVPGPVERIAHWVDPDLVGEVAYAEWTGEQHLILQRHSGEGVAASFVMAEACLVLASSSPVRP
jgi:bifunctional non-homologous end joining protein LigD